MVPSPDWAAGRPPRTPDPNGRRLAVLFTKTHDRILAQGLALLNPLPPEIHARIPIARAWQGLDKALDDFIDRQMIAA